MTTSVLTEKQETPPLVETKADRQILSLTGLRFVAAFIILQSHLLPKVMPWPSVPPDWFTQIVSTASLAMSLFFVMSGFVIHYNYSGQMERDEARGIYNFYVARIARVYPLFLAIFAYQILFSFSYGQLPEKALQMAPFHLMFMQTWFYSTMGKCGLVFELGTLLTATWSISCEVFFYCCYPLVRKAANLLSGMKAKIIAWVLVSILALSTILTATHFESEINAFGAAHFGTVSEPAVKPIYTFYRWLVYFSPYVRILEFILGVITASIFMQMRSQEASLKEQKIGTVVLCSSIVFAFALNVFYTWAMMQKGPVHIFGGLLFSCGMAPLLAAVLFCISRYKTFLTKTLCFWPFLLCGEATYSLYLLHTFITMSLRWESAPVVNAWIGVGDVMRFCMGVLISVGFSLVTWRIIEVPAREWVRNKFTAKARTNLEA